MKTAFLSIILAVMNILPIPGLDGGHAIFTFWEMITGRKVSDKILEARSTWTVYHPASAAVRQRQRHIPVFIK
ncbi:MAG: site-2 protease family protein [Alistipes finegoldii]